MTIEQAEALIRARMAKEQPGKVLDPVIVNRVARALIEIQAGKDVEEVLNRIIIDEARRRCKKSLTVAAQIALMIAASIAVFLLIMAVRPTAAASIIANPKSKTIEISGRIQDGDFNKFSAKLGAFPETRTIHLISGGGLVREAWRISRLLQLFELATFVPAGQTCASACVVAWAAGFPRALGRGANLYVHCIFDMKTRICKDDSTKQVTDYLKQLKMPQVAIDSMLNSHKPSDKILVRRTSDLVRTELTPTEAGWLIEVRKLVAEKTDDIAIIKAWQKDACAMSDGTVIPRCNDLFGRMLRGREWERVQLMNLQRSIETGQMDQERRDRIMAAYKAMLEKDDALWRSLTSVSSYESSTMSNGSNTYDDIPPVLFERMPPAYPWERHARRNKPAAGYPAHVRI
jgi:hypothetical protein